MNTSRNTNPNSPAMMSTTALAKHFDLPAKTLFTFLTEKSWIDRVDNLLINRFHFFISFLKI
jgi:hypothetical protein